MVTMLTAPTDIERAEHYYERAVAQDPDQNPLLWHQLGQIHFLNGKFDEAITTFGERIGTPQRRYPKCVLHVGIDLWV
ncbi:MAG: tetratricopeptide repeat protein [Candidatus Paceibacterota bacterium]